MRPRIDLASPLVPAQAGRAPGGTLSRIQLADRGGYLRLPGRSMATSECEKPSFS